MLYCMCFVNFWEQILQEKLSSLKYASWWNLVLLLTGKEGDLGQNIALCFCYQLRKGASVSDLVPVWSNMWCVFHCLVLHSNVHTVAIPCYLYITNFFIWVSIPLALFLKSPSIFWSDKTQQFNPAGPQDNVTLDYSTFTWLLSSGVSLAAGCVVLEVVWLYIGYCFSLCDCSCVSVLLSHSNTRCEQAMAQWRKACL